MADDTARGLDKRRLRGLTESRLAEAMGMRPAEVRLARRRFNDVATADLPEEAKAAILEMVTELTGEVDLGPVLVARLLEVPAPLSTWGELLEVKGLGVERLARLGRALADTEVSTLIGLGGDVRSLGVLVAALRRGPSRELVDLIATGRVTAVLGDDFPFLDEIIATVTDPSRATAADFDLAGFAALTATVAGALPTRDFLRTFFPDPAEPLQEESEEVADRPPMAVLDEDWPRPEEKNPRGCPPLTVTFGRVEVAPAVLGDLDGLRRVLGDLVALLVLLGRLNVAGLAALDRVLPFLAGPLQGPASEILKRLRALIAGGDTPPADPLGDIASTLVRIVETVDRLSRADIRVRRSTQPKVLDPEETTLEVTGPPGVQVFIDFRSAMESAYTFGRGLGTEDPDRPADDRRDRPWFAKVAPRSRGEKVQLGVAEDRILETLDRNGRLTLQVEANGNYGRARAVVQIDGTACRYGSPLFRVIGEYREDIEAREAVRFKNVEEVLRKIEASADLICEALDVLKDLASIVPVAGATLAALVQVAKTLFVSAVKVLVEEVIRLNEEQAEANRAVAALYPQRL